MQRMLTYRLSNGPIRPFAASMTIEVPRGTEVCVDLAPGGEWYGHGFSHTQPYPLNSGMIDNPRFAVNNIQCPLWLCSSGYALLADTNELLSVSINKGGDGMLRVSAPQAAFCLRVFRGETLPQAWREAMAYVGWPNQPPDAATLGDCLFTTWTQYPRCIDQARVVEMARAIRAHGYPCSRLMLDDRWESSFGTLAFSTDFPDPAGMVRELRRMDFRVWLWVTPFVNVESPGFDLLASSGVLVQRRQGTGAALLTWWGGTAGLVDVTAPAGRAWFRERLLHLRDDFGIEGFKVDGGDFKYQPAPEESAWGDFPGPSGYADALLALVSEIVPNHCETRTAWRSQGRSVLWREGGKDSHWGLDNGLRAMVTLGLNLGLLGYDILIPDMVPGRVQTLASNHPLPTDELLIRWTEASVFMPITQFSYLPWNYAPETAQIVRAYALLHQALAPYLAAQAADRAAPLLRPVWFAAPDMPALFNVADEMMLGSDLLAAPVLDEAQTSRQVVLPPGLWLDAWTGRQTQGGITVSCDAPCPGIPVFVRAENRTLFETIHAALREIPRGGILTGVTTTRYTAGLDRKISVTG